MPNSQSPNNNKQDAWKDREVDPDKEIIFDKKQDKFIETKPTVKADNIDAGGPGEVDPWAPVYPQDGSSEDIEGVVMPTKFERMAQKMQECLVQQNKLDPSGQQRTYAIVATTTQGKIWHILADSTGDDQFKDWEIWSRIFVESEITKVKTAFEKSAARFDGNFPGKNKIPNPPTTTEEQEQQEKDKNFQAAIGQSGDFREAV